ncbi:hypothetical protein D9M72_403900 [compost metagenome]
MEQGAVAVYRDTTVTVRECAERDHHDGSKAGRNEQAYRPDELVAREHAVLCRQERDQERGIDRGVAVLSHAQSDADQDVLLGVLPQLADGVLDHVLVLFELLEYRRFLEPQPNEDGHRNKDDAGQERHTPQPAFKDGFVSHGDQCKRAGTEEGAQLDADERQGSKESTATARRHFGNQCCCTGLFSTGAEALEDAQGHEQDRAQHARLLERGQQPDGEACGSHQADREDQHHFSAEPVTDDAKDDAAEGTGSKPDAVRGERRDQRAVLTEGLEEEGTENQG